MTAKWICCQIGAREHYVIPRALSKRMSLQCLITDVWARPNSLLAGLKHDLRERFHPELAEAKVCASNVSALAFEARARLGGVRGWRLMRQRNKWFQQRALVEIVRHSALKGSGDVTLFAYSYAAGRLLQFAHRQGWRTVLGQIDAGPLHERIVAELNEAYLAWRGDRRPAPPEYWDDWRNECALAERIVVNSTWSRDALIQEGVAATKISIVPVAFEKPLETKSFERRYPAAFTPDRPMRVLFLGQINLAKGVGQLLEAAKLLRDEPAEFWFVGPVHIAVPAELKRIPQMQWIGPVPRREVAKYYREADVFVFPTLSDGFGLTQLEAQSWKLPVVASRFCGDVVRDGVNGVILKEVSGATITAVLFDFLRNPGKLHAMAAGSGIEDKFSLDSLATSLLSL